MLPHPHVAGMSPSDVLVEAESPFQADASKLLRTARFDPVLESPRIREPFQWVIHQVSAEEQAALHGNYHKVALKVEEAISSTLARHQGSHVVFFLPGLADDDFVHVFSHLSTRPNFPAWNIVQSVASAVARLIENVRVKPSAQSLVMDAVPGIETLGDDLRDDDSGRLDARKIAKLYGLSLSDIARAAAVSKQALDQTPDSEKAQPGLRKFEQVSRLRMNPQFKDAAAFRKWFRRPLPLFGNHSAETLVKAGKLSHVAAKVDQLLTGDFGG